MINILKFNNNKKNAFFYWRISENVKFSKFTFNFVGLNFRNETVKLNYFSWALLSLVINFDINNLNFIVW